MINFFLPKNTKFEEKKLDFKAICTILLESLTCLPFMKQILTHSPKYAVDRKKIFENKIRPK